jgi:hypothetical protein
LSFGGGVGLGPGGSGSGPGGVGVGPGGTGGSGYVMLCEESFDNVGL